jgi:hypothetical protein
METWPHLYSYCINETISLQQALILLDAADMFHLPLSEEALAQFHLFEALLLNIVPSQNVDSWTIFLEKLVLSRFPLYINPS